MIRILSAKITGRAGSPEQLSPPCGQGRQLLGLWLSLCLHALLVAGMLAWGAYLPAPRPQLVIDFSIQDGGGAQDGMRMQARETESRPPTDRLTEPKAPPVKKTRVVQEKKRVVQPAKEKIVVRKTAAELPDAVPVPEKPQERRAVAVRQPAEDAVQEDAVETEAVEPVAVAAETEAAGHDAAPGGVQAAAASSDGGAGRGQPGGREQYLKRHFRYIKDRIQRSICYPRIARKRGWEGRVVISFVVCEDGRIQDMRIVESSGFSALDKNAMAAVHGAVPFPRPPVRAELIVPVVYRLS